VNACGIFIREGNEKNEKDEMMHDQVLCSHQE
jgi:hypothetical protein